MKNSRSRLFAIALLLSTICTAQTRPAWIKNQDEETVRALIKKMADSRNAHDGDAAAATYSDDGEYTGSDRIFKGRTELAILWGSMRGQMQRTIQNVEFIAPGIAIVHVVCDYSSPAIRGREVFVVFKDNAGWKIKGGETVPWNDGRWNIPAGSPEPGTN